MLNRVPQNGESFGLCELPLLPESIISKPVRHNPELHSVRPAHPISSFLHAKLLQAAMYSLALITIFVHGRCLDFRSQMFSECLD